MQPIVSVVIPAYNQEKTITQTIMSAIVQNFTNKEILVVDDCSTDRTARMSNSLKARVVINDKNLGITENFKRCANLARGKYVVYLCGDDMFADEHVLSDIVKIFEKYPDVGIIDRNYYQYMDGHEGAVMEVREDNILISSINPSGMAFRKEAIGEFSDKIYMEVPYMIKEALKKWKYKKLHYDTIKVRIHKKNLALDKNYYHGSMLQNWYRLIGKSHLLWDFKCSYIPLKNRVSTKYLLKEIAINIKLEPKILLHPAFYFYALLAILTPRKILIWLSDIYRHYWRRMFCTIQKRKGEPI